MLTGARAGANILRGVAISHGGGADGMTGTHSVYSAWQGMEIMFHVANLMPVAPNDPQQVSVPGAIAREA